MNFEFATQINPRLTESDFEQALKIGERGLSKIPPTDFHEIIGKSLLDQTDSLVDWIDSFYKKTSKKIKIQAMYFELNEFDINTDEWYLDGFAYKQDGGLDDIEWLADVTRDLMTQKEFKIRGLEDLQAAFEQFDGEGEISDDLQSARDWCEQLVIARFMELLRATHLTAKKQGLEWSGVPVYCTEHEYDFIYKSLN
jgi:hypothetical protein